MNRTKPYRIVQRERHQRKSAIVQWIVRQKEDCGKPKKGKCNG